ncbi:MAG: beta-ketoacyl-ACP synthase [Pseudomonadales bacterium]
MSSKQRVVITGAGNLSPLGNDWPTVRQGLREGHSGVTVMQEWANIKGLRCHLAAPTDLQLPPRYNRRALRSMGRVAQLAVRSAELAIEAAGLPESVLQNGRTGIAYGSATGSPDAALEFVSTLTHADSTPLKSTSYLRMMSHTGAVNIGVFFGITGRMLTTSSACTAASQAIGFAYETVRDGIQDVMLAGGSDELTSAHSAVFDALLATSQRNDHPQSTPRPFDSHRDGLVLGEGASTLIIESLAHARARGATIIGEIVGFATNTDGSHITAPNTDTQAQCLRLALADAKLDADAIGYVNAHGTATDAGDQSECEATFQVLGRKPISSLKGHMGHTLGACGGLEAWASIMMQAEGWFAPTLNLTQPDPQLANLDYLRDAPRELDCEHLMSNNFAFGGINTSLILRRFSG